MPSSSPAIWRMAMRRPWPRSTLPQNSVTVPSPSMARKESSSFGSSIRAAGAEDYAAGDVAPLRHLLLDKGGLQRMRRGNRTEPFQGDDRLALCIGNPLAAGSHRPAVEENGAGAALAETAAELGGGES